MNKNVCLEELKLKKYILSYLDDLDKVSSYNKKRELYFDLFLFLFNDGACIKIFNSDNKINKIISDIVSNNLKKYLSTNEFNDIYIKYNKINNNYKDDCFFETGNVIKEMDI